MADAHLLITENVDVWTTAIKKRSATGRGNNKKIELAGIKKLRELILELAVRGKLVPQDPNDEPASVLLGKIAAEKAQLIKDKKIKKPKVLPKIGGDEKPFELPCGWKWSRLCDIGIIGSSSRVHKKDWTNKGVPFYRAREIVKLSNSGFVDNELFITEELFLNLSESGAIPEHRDLMITGVGTIGTPYIVKKEDKFYFKDASVLIFKNYFNLSPQFLYYFFKSPCWINAIYANSMGTTVHTLTISRANETLIPMPPLAEQHRIVAKVDELMVLCDQLEQQTEDSITAHQTLVETLLATLSNSENPATFKQNWTRIAEHFDTLFTTEHSIDQLKQTILQLAVMGKLVPQNPNDEPASELLEKIAAEKEQLIKDKKITKPKVMLEISNEDKLFMEPKGWKWVRLDLLFNVIVDCPHSTAKFQDSGLLCIDTNTFKQGELQKHKFRFVSKKTFVNRNARLVPQAQDIVFAREGSVGESVVIPNGVECCLGQRVMLFRPSFLLNAEFLRLTISSPSAITKLMSMHKGIGAKHVNVRDMRVYPACIPPQEEQHRIVKKVDELMTLCDGLKASINNAQTKQLQLANTVVEQAVS